MCEAGRVRTWRAAMQEALYGPHGYYIRGGRGPGHDYRTSSTTSPAYAAALLTLIGRVDEALGHPARLDVVEVAAVDGRLLRELHSQASPDLTERMRLHGVDLAPRPPDLSTSISWSAGVPETSGLLFANEWLDNIALDVVELTDEGLRLVLVDDDGVESHGPPPPAQDLEWLERWWPVTEVGDRAEVGLPRDLAWAHAVAQLHTGVAVAVDYATLRADRVDGAYAGGTLVGYRDGRVTLPIPDGEGDLTAHVALDATAAAADADTTTIRSQRDVLRELGVTGTRPPIAMASTDPAAFMVALNACSADAELISPGGLGALLWLIQTKDCRLDVTSTGPD